MIVSIIKAVTSSKKYIILLFYLFIGTVFIVQQQIGSDFFSMMASVLLNKLYLVIFVFPVFACFTYDLYGFLERNFCVIGRLTRKQYAKMQIKLCGAGFFLLYISFLLVIVIAFNLFHQYDIGFRVMTFPKGENIFNGLFLGMTILRSILLLFTFQILNLFLLTHIEKKQISFLILTAFFVLFFIVGESIPAVWGEILPNAHFYRYLPHISYLLSDCFYYIVINILLYLEIGRKTYRVEFIKEG